MSRKGWILFRRVYKAAANSTVDKFKKQYRYKFKNGFKFETIEEMMIKAIECFLEVYNIDITKCVVLICEDDTAL